MQSNLMKTHIDLIQLLAFMCKLIHLSILSHYSQAKSKSYPMKVIMGE